jgi:hypothetical protein
VLRFQIRARTLIIIGSSVAEPRTPNSAKSNNKDIVFRESCIVY